MYAILGRLKRTDPVLWGILILAGVLLFTGLESVSTWRDEAQVMSVGRNLAETGIPKAWDGQQYVTQPGDRNAQGILWLHSWLEFYIVAAASAVFGGTLGGIRVGFALFGLAAVFLTYTLAMTLFQRRTTARIAAVLLATCTVFLLHARQARYYVIAVFFALAIIHAYLRVLQKKPWSRTLFTATAVLLFHANWFTFFTLFLCLIADLARRTVRIESGKLRLQPGPWKTFALLAIPIAALTAPLFLWLKPYAGTESIWMLMRTFTLETAQYHGLTLSVFIFPLALLAGAEFFHIKGLNRVLNLLLGLLAGLLVQAAFLRGLSHTLSALALAAAAAGMLAALGRLYRTGREPEGFLWQTIIIAVAFAAIRAAQFRDIRYVLYLAPLAFILVGRKIDWLCTERFRLPWGATAVTALLVFSTAAPMLAFAPLKPAVLESFSQNPTGLAVPGIGERIALQSPLLQYWSEIRQRPVDGPEASCRALQRHGQQGQTVLTTRDVWGLPLIFHCPGFIINQEEFARPVLFGYEPIGEPDWIIVALKPIGQEYLRNYTRVPLADHERAYTVFEESNRPEPWLHKFSGRELADFELWQHQRHG